MTKINVVAKNNDLSKKKWPTMTLNIYAYFRIISNNTSETLIY